MREADRDYEHWRRIAEEWIAWARAPGHDAFWAYRASLLEFMGRGKGDALDVGCGEGRVSRALRECGYRVTAVDPVEAFVRAAEEMDSADRYEVATATELPFEDGRFDLVVAYNVLMDVEDVSGALKEIKRVVRPSGTVLISIVHPFADLGRFASREPDAPFVVNTSYFGKKRFDSVEERGGLRMHFAGWSRPLESYVAALEDAGLAVTSLREPVPAEELSWGHMRRWERVPLFLWMKARAIAGSAPQGRANQR